MNNNYFAFSDTTWKQLKGTAMGIACAPCFASLFLAAIKNPILIEFKEHIELAKRFIDDGFIL